MNSKMVAGADYDCVYLNCQDLRSVDVLQEVNAAGKRVVHGAAVEVAAADAVCGKGKMVVGAGEVEDACTAGPLAAEAGLLVEHIVVDIQQRADKDCSQVVWVGGSVVVRGEDDIVADVVAAAVAGVATGFRSHSLRTEHCVLAGAEEEAEVSTTGDCSQQPEPVREPASLGQPSSCSLVVLAVVAAGQAEGGADVR